MPLRKDRKRRSTDSDSRTADVSLSNTRTADDREKAGDYEEQEEEEEEEDEAQDAWLESLGVENSEIRKINHSQVHECDTESEYTVLVMVCSNVAYFRRG